MFPEILARFSKKKKNNNNNNEKKLPEMELIPGQQHTTLIEGQSSPHTLSENNFRISEYLFTKDFRLVTCDALV